MSVSISIPPACRESALGARPLIGPISLEIAGTSG